MKGLVKAVARKYKLYKRDKHDFNDAWRLADRARGRKNEDAQQREVNRAFGRLRDAVEGRPNRLLGHYYTHERQVRGERYVVFSDHHITHDGNRQEFFSKNVGLYANALARYHSRGYTLVENGDVEELIIFEPDDFKDEYQKRRRMDRKALARRRDEVRLQLLDRILTDPKLRAWREATQAFDRDRRLIRIAGNHDYDLQQPQFLQKLQKVFPNVGQVYDYLMLRDGDRARYVVCHGHQFDKATNPTWAPIIGETVSECLAIWFQGADRVWRWQGDYTNDWATGARRFNNRLVRDDVAGGEAAGFETAPAVAPNVEEVPEELRELVAEVQGDIAEAMREDEDPQSGGEETAALERVRIPVLNEGLWRSTFEALFHHSVAWEYFHHRNALTAVLKEVVPGKRFFKYRHLDEETVRYKMTEHFPNPADRPVLVLGHTHEARLSPVSQYGDAWPFYLNSGAAGRFENLIWAIEIEDGQSRLVSWSVGPGGGVQRREWRPDGHYLRATAFVGLP